MIMSNRINARRGAQQFPAYVQHHHVHCVTKSGRRGETPAESLGAKQAADIQVSKSEWKVPRLGVTLIP
jgi:hypothetical protein